MLKNGLTYVKNLAVFIPQDFKSIFDHFPTLFIKGLTQFVSISPSLQCYPLPVTTGHWQELEQMGTSVRNRLTH